MCDVRNAVQISAFDKSISHGPMCHPVLFTDCAFMWVKSTQGWNSLSEQNEQMEKDVEEGLRFVLNYLGQSYGKVS